MPVYQYKGQYYELSETDPAAAKAKILSHLGEQAPAAPVSPPQTLAAQAGLDQRPFTPAGFMLRPEFVEQVRSEYGNLPPEQRRTALQEASMGRGVRADAAKRILADLAVEDQRRREVTQGREGLMGILAAAQQQPAPRQPAAPAGPAPRVQFPDVSPTIGDIMDMVPEQERIQRRLAQDEAARTLEAAESSIEATRAREQERMGGVEQLIESLKIGGEQAKSGALGLTAVAQQAQMAKVGDQLKELEAQGQGNTPQADRLRKVLEHYSSRQQVYLGDLAQTQAKLSTAPVYKGVRELTEAETFTDAAKAFARNPVSIVANLTAQSLPSMLPALVLGVINPALGVAAMGGSSYGVEFGNELLGFAREKGFDTTNPQQMAQFMQNSELLREGVNRAGTKAGIVAAGDMLLTGLAAKTLVPKRITGPVAKNVTNVGAQMGVQSVGGAGTEALAQYITTGEIKPGEVVAEAVGELGGAPAEVLAQTAQARREARAAQQAAAPTAEPPAAAPAAPVPPAPPAAPAVEPERVAGLFEQLAKESQLPPAEAPAAPAEAPVQEAAPVAPPVEQPPAAPAEAPTAPVQEAVAPEVTPPTEPVQEIEAPEAPPVTPAIAELEQKYAQAKSALDALGAEPPKPSSESRFFGAAGREGAAPDVVKRYDDAVKANAAWRRKYSKLKKAEVDASNELFRARQAVPAVTTPKVVAEETKAEGKKPPLLPKPKGFEPKRGRKEQIVLAARELAAGRITKAEYDEYIEEYNPIRTVLGGIMEPPVEDGLMKQFLTEREFTEGGKKYSGIPKLKDPEKVNAPIADGTRVGLRMDIPALDWGKANGINGSIVSIHKGAPLENADAGENLSYRSTGVIKNVKMAIRREEDAFKVARQAEPELRRKKTGEEYIKKVDEKKPQQTMEGEWVNMSPEETFQLIQQNLDNPDWVQVSLDPLRHSYFYDRKSKRPVVAADEALQVGRFVLVKNPVYGKREDFLYSLGRQGSEKRTAKQVKSLEQDLRKALDKFGLGEVGVKLAKGMREEASYAAKIIKIAADSANPIRALRHETIHALRDLGFFTPQQWQALSKMAKDEWIDTYLKQRNVDGEPLKAGEESRYAAYMREYNGDMEKITEEAVADAFADFDATNKPPAGMVAAILKRLRNFFKAIKSAITKVESPEQIFGKIEEGKVRPAVPRTLTQRLRNNWIVMEDELGRLKLTPGAKAYSIVAHIANNVLDRFALKPVSPELGRMLRNMKVQIEKVQTKTVELSKELAKLSPQEREMISDVIEGELEAGVHPPQHILDIAAAMQHLMSQQSKELVDLDMLSKEAALRWENKYLPRFYLSKLKDDVNAWAKAAKNLIRREPMMQGIKGKNLKARGVFETIPVEDLQDWIDLGWEQRDPNFNPNTSTETVVWRDHTKEKRQEWGEIRDSMFRFVMGYNATQRDIALGRLYKDIAENYASKSPQEGFVQVPDTKVEGTRAHRYGKLAGMYVPKEVLDQLVFNDQEMANGALKLYRAALSRWKEGKTVLNPVTHANNVLSNLTMAHFAGVSYWDAPKYAGAIKDIVTNKDMLKEAKDVGLFSGSFSQSELVESMPPELRAMANMTESQIAKLGDRLWDLLAYTVEFKGRKIGVRPAARWMYENEDSFFRYLIYRDARNRGLDPQDARDYSQKFIFTYDDLPKGARMLRDFAIPFFSYAYKAVPVLTRTALEYPWRYAAPATALYAANAFAYAMAAEVGGGEDDWWGKTLYKYVTDPEFRAKAKALEDAERKNLPPWMKGGSTSLSTPKAIRLGMDDATGLPLFLDTSKIFPGGDILDAANNAGGADILQPLMPTNPVLTSMFAILGNRDMFFGKDVVNDKGDTDAEKAAKRTAWLWKQIAPAISIGNYHFDRGMNVIANVTGKPIVFDAGPFGAVYYTGVGRDLIPITPGYAALQTFGIKVKPYDLEVGERIQENDQNKLIRQLAIEISSINKKERAGSMPPEAAEIERSIRQRKLDLLRDGLNVEGKPRE